MANYFSQFNKEFLFELPEVEKMMNDSNAVKLCKQGHLGVTIEEYQNQWGSQFKVKWTDR